MGTYALLFHSYLATLLSEPSQFINTLVLCYYPMKAEKLTLFTDVSSNEVIYISTDRMVAE